MNRATTLFAASTFAIWGATAAFAGTAFAGSWMTLHPWGGAPYCADGADFQTGSHHLSSNGGTLYMLGCDENDFDEAPVYAYDHVRTGDFVGVGGGFLEYVSVLPNGHAWGVSNFEEGGKTYFWNGSSWRQVSRPGGGAAFGVAAVDDWNAFVLASAPGYSCPGGYCVFTTNDGGSTWSNWATDWDGPLGALDIVYDPRSGQPWLLDDRGHVIDIFYDSDRGITGSWDVGVVGLPYNDGAPGGLRIAAANGQPWVIANVGSWSGGGPVYRLSGGQWWPVGTVTDATDISVDPDGGQPWIITYNGPVPGPAGSDNILYWQDLR
jgi:hypothetical protein